MILDPALAGALAELPRALGWHALLSGAALALAAAAALPLAILSARSPALRWPILAGAGLAQTIPALALLALFYPLLLLLSGLTRRLFGFGFPALGFLPSLLALALYGLLPMLRNGVAGLLGVDPEIREAADGVGMSPWQRLVKVEAPLAAPVAFAGLRTAAVWVIGGATLATSVGQTCLGDYIFAGLQTETWSLVLFGCFASAGLALAVDQLLGLLGRAAFERRAGLAALVAAILGLGLLLAGAGAFGLGGAPGAPGAASRGAAYVVGAKNFSEQYVLADVLKDRIEAEGGSARVRSGLGSAIAFKALAAGDLDVYVDYSGTLWSDVLGRRDIPPRKALLSELSAELSRRYGVRVLGALGFENAYALAMRPDRAAALQARSIGDLAPAAPRLTLGADLEFLARPEWRRIQRFYGLDFGRERRFQPTFLYAALESGETDVISAFSSDGRVAADHLVLLADPRGAIPPYDAVVLASPRRRSDPRLLAAVQPLLGRIPLSLMQKTNLLVDRDQDKMAPETAARRLEAALGLGRR